MCVLKKFLQSSRQDTNDAEQGVWDVNIKFRNVVSFRLDTME